MVITEPSALRSAESIAAERVAADRLEKLGYRKLTWKGGRNRGHDVVAEALDDESGETGLILGRLLADAKKLDRADESERAKGCGTFKVVCWDHEPWSTVERTHLVLVALPEAQTVVEYDDAHNMTITVRVAGAQVFLVPVEDMNQGLVPWPGKRDLWLEDEWLEQYRLEDTAPRQLADAGV